MLKTYLMSITMALILLQGCSTMPSKAYRDVMPLIQTVPTTDNSTIVVRRDVGVMGSACSLKYI